MIKILVYLPCTSEVSGSNLRGGDDAKFCSEFGISQFGTIYEGQEETFATKVPLLDFAHLAGIQISISN